MLSSKIHEIGKILWKNCSKVDFPIRWNYFIGISIEKKFLNHYIIAFFQKNIKKVIFLVCYENFNGRTCVKAVRFVQICALAILRTVRVIYFSVKRKLHTEIPRHYLHSRRLYWTDLFLYDENCSRSVLYWFFRFYLTYPFEILIQGTRYIYLILHKLTDVNVL